MTPNLFLATQKVFSPHKWFRTPPKTERATRKIEFWEDPTPGQYEYIPGRGWYLIAEQTNTSAKPTEPREFSKLSKPIQVHRSRVLGRYFLEDEYAARKKYGVITNARGKKVEVGFFRLDDKIAWVQCWDENGQFIAQSEYKRWTIDAQTGQFRHLRKSDDPNHSSHSRSRNPSLDRDRDNTDSRSEQSASTGYLRSPRDGPSVSSTRPSSLRRAPLSNPTSTPGSRVQSRRNSLKRNDSIPLEEAKAALRRMAREHEVAVQKALLAREQSRFNEKEREGKGGVRVEHVEKGRAMA